MRQLAIFAHGNPPPKSILLLYDSFLSIYYIDTLTWFRHLLAIKRVERIVAGIFRFLSTNARCLLIRCDGVEP